MNDAEKKTLADAALKSLCSQANALGIPPTALYELMMKTHDHIIEQASKPLVCWSLFNGGKLMNAIEWTVGSLKPQERRQLLECWCGQGGWVDIKGQKAIVANGEFFFIDEGGNYVAEVTNHDVADVAIKLAR